MAAAAILKNHDNSVVVRAIFNEIWHTDEV